jgi:hypothetical protein
VLFKELPAALASTFPNASTGVGALVGDVDAAPSSERTPQAEAGGSKGEKDDQKKDDAAPVLEPWTNDANLKSVKFGGQVAKDEDETVTVTFVVADGLIEAVKEHSKLKETPALDKEKAYLLPVVEGKVDAIKPVEIELLTGQMTYDSEKKTTTLVAQFAAKDASAVSTAGVAVRFSEAKKSYMISRSTTADTLFFNPFAGAAPKSDDKKEEKQEKKQSNLTASGDPATNPLTKLDGPFDVLLLPDFSEQYAISFSAGIGLLELDIGLENGWMLEKLNTKLDNTEVGAFVTETLTKVIDFKLGAAKEAASALAGAPTKLSGSLRGRVLQSMGTKASVTPVLLKIIRVEYATPGLYPVRKPSEIDPNGRDKACKNSRLSFPFVDFETRKDVRIVVVRAGDAEISDEELALAVGEFFNKDEALNGVSKPTNEFMKLEAWKYLSISIARSDDGKQRVVVKASVDGGELTDPKGLAQELADDAKRKSSQAALQKALAEAWPQDFAAFHSKFGNVAPRVDLSSELLR